MTPRQPNPSPRQTSPSAPNTIGAHGPMDCCVVIPVFNQLSFTTGCLASLRRTGVPDSRIVVVNNGSTDGTREFLEARPLLRVIHNEANRGCAVAWNQGVKATTTKWTVILNNDVLVTQGWREGLITFAQEEACDIVSPAMCEGELDYDLDAHAQEVIQTIGQVRRLGVAHGVCFMVYRHVFDAIGFFDEKIGLAGYEDDDFFRRARRAGFRLAVTGRAFLHHFGSVTQESIKSQRVDPGARLADRDYVREKHHQTWLVRRKERIRENVQTAVWRLRERRCFGLTLHMRRSGGEWRFF